MAGSSGAVPHGETSPPTSGDRRAVTGPEIDAELHAEVVDKKLIEEVARRLQISPSEVAAEDERPRLKAILGRCPELQAASDQVRAFAAMLTQLTGQDLPQWISDARDAGLPGISSFARGLEQDLDAVTNGLTMPWNSGPVEGRVNHIKMIKRQMFGRAGLPLLRKRVLLTARN